MANHERAEFGYRFGFRSEGRKLLVGKAELIPAPAAPPASGSACTESKSGPIVSCQNPHTVVMIVAGMSCMMFLVTVALILLCWSIVRQRRHQRRQGEPGAEQQDDDSSAPHTTIGQTVPVDSPEYDDAVFVQLPGEEKPQSFALPKPFMANGEKDVKTKSVDSANDGNSVEKEVAAADANCQPDDDTPCVLSSDGLERSPVFAPH